MSMEQTLILEMCPFTAKQLSEKKEKEGGGEKEKAAFLLHLAVLYMD